MLYSTFSSKFLLARAGGPRIRIYSRDEHKQAALAHELQDDRVTFILGDVRDEAQVRRALDGCDAVVHAALPPATSPRARALAAPAAPTPPPRTGAELAAWRAARGLSQASAAAALGVGIATVKRAESDPAEVLGRAFSGAPWGAVAPVEGGGRGIARAPR